MTRPNIVRADTLDLQDTDGPTAAEHQKHPNPHGLAPHQRAEISHIEEERHSEELALNEAWNIADENLNDDPSLLEEAQEHQHDLNGNSVEGGADGEEGADSEDADDDLMDRISSSPSIDEGVYHSPPSSPPDDGGGGGGGASSLPRDKWPGRKSSLSPLPSSSPPPSSSESPSHRSISTPPPSSCSRGAFNQSPSSPTDSSPYMQTPEHLPVHVRRIRKGLSLLRSASPFSEKSVHGWPKQTSLPWQLSLGQKSTFTSVHHHTGRYELERNSGRVETPDVTTGENGCFDKRPNWSPKKDGGNLFYDAREVLDDDEEDFEDAGAESPMKLHQEPVTISQVPQLLSRPLFRVSAQQLEPSPSLNSITSVNLEEVLLPVDDPLLDVPPPSPTNSSDSWEDIQPPDPETNGTRVNKDENDGTTDTLFLDLDERFIDSGWGGECLQDTENIDFDFVYALHTFVATVDGQATAQKGDTMVLLDDSNSYWWLVRVVRDSNVGYLPAEHIETPPERVARLNKHRNIDLAQAMLGDGAEKNMNPLRKAMRRRNAKTVQFAAPTYVEASDYEYSDDEDQTEAETSLDGVEAETAQQQQQQQQNTTDEPEAEAEAEARSSTDSRTRSSSPRRRSFDREQAATVAAAAETAENEEPQVSPKLVDKTEAAPLKSKKGVARNRDSFLKDDGIETRKITLTPGLLREENSSLKSPDSDSQRNDSVDSLTLTKSVSPPEQSQVLTKKDSKKEKKEKKPGMLSGLFRSKKKDKKSKDDLGAEVDAEKPSMELSRDSSKESPATSGRTSPSSEATANSPIETRRPEPATRIPTGAPLQARKPSDLSISVHTEQPPRSISQAGEVSTYTPRELPPEELDPETTDLQQRLNVINAQNNAKEGNSPVSPLAPITNLLKRDDSKSQKPTKAKRSKQRVELDDFDSPVEEAEGEEDANPFKDSERAPEDRGADGEDGSLGESPVEITQGPFAQAVAATAAAATAAATAAVATTAATLGYSSGDPASSSKTDDSLSSSPSIIEHPNSASSSAEKSVLESEDSDPTPTGPRSPHLNDTTSTNPPTTKQPITVTTSNPTAKQSTGGATRNLSTDTTSSTTTATSTASTSAQSPSSSQQSWSDSSLRSWLDDGSEVKDMMVLIHDTSGVEPVSNNHPMMAGLFDEERKGVQGMMAQLDGLLGGFLEGRGIKVG